MPAYLDFIMVFGAQSEPKDLRFSGFREQVRLRTPATALPIKSLGRSGRHFQLCYNLKSVCFKKRSNEELKLDEWSIRQAAIYHQFDVETGTALWIVTKGGDDLLDRYEELIGPRGRQEDKQFGDPGLCLGSSLATHLLFCHWSTEDWRWYIRWLEEVLDHEVRHLIPLSSRPISNSCRAIWQYMVREVKALHIDNISPSISKTSSDGRTERMKR